MAGNNSIQILRGTSANIVASDQTLLAGQMLYNTDKNYLTIGSNDGDSLTGMPIAARELVAYGNNTEVSSITGNTTRSASVTALPNIVDIGASRVRIFNNPSQTGHQYMNMSQAGIQINSSNSAGVTINGYSITIAPTDIPLVINTYQATLGMYSTSSFPMRLQSVGQLSMYGDVGTTLGTTTSRTNVIGNSIYINCSQSLTLASNSNIKFEIA